MPRYIPETKFIRSNNFVYNLSQYGWRQGEPAMVNDIYFSVYCQQPRADGQSKREMSEEVAQVIIDALNKHYGFNSK